MRVHVNETKQDSMCLKKVPWKGWPTIGGEGDGVSNWTSSGVIGKRVKSTNNCFGGLMLIFDLLEALEMEALVDAMDVDNG
ncbi:hypothetical protein Tco_1403575 [Tanacetum coccineum]